MYDYLKIWIEHKQDIYNILSHSLLSFTGSYKTDTGEVIEYPKVAIWERFKFKQFSQTRIQITGSLHKYWNNGTNENDFTLDNVNSAIDRFCKMFRIDAMRATIHNLEFGVNINPSFSASEIIEDVICFKNVQPSWPYEGNDNQFYFIEFKRGNNYLKVYDKGKQYKTVNTLRIEVKSMRSAELKQSGAITLHDLKCKSVFKVLGRKLMQFSSNIIFNDSTIDLNRLTKKENSLYKEMINPRNWIIKGRKSTTQYRKEIRFIQLVDKYGGRNIYTHIRELVKDKVKELQTVGCNTLLSKYTDKPLQDRACKSCGKDISNQNPRSVFCSSKFVGEAAAHQCRNRNSNPRNNLKGKIRRINSRGVLFDISPYLIVNNNKKQVYGI